MVPAKEGKLHLFLKPDGFEKAETRPANLLATFRKMEPEYHV